MDAKSEADRFIGIDVSKAWFDVHVRPDGAAFYCTTDSEGLAELIGRLTPLRPRLVVLEASSGYEGVVAADRFHFEPTTGRMLKISASFIAKHDHHSGSSAAPFSIGESGGGGIMTPS
jgi:hypothetical protein